MHHVLVELINYAIKKKGILDSQLSIELGLSEGFMRGVRDGSQIITGRAMFELIELLELEPVVIAIMSIDKTNPLKFDSLKDNHKPNPRKVQKYINMLAKAYRDTEKTNTMFDTSAVRNKPCCKIRNTPVEKSQW